MPASGDDLEAELATLLAQIDELDAQAAGILDDARAEAVELRQRAVRDATAIVEEARGRADAEQARAASAQADAVVRQFPALRDGARREVARIDALRDERVEELLGEVLECVRRAGR